MQAGEEVHLPVSYYDDDGDGVADCPAIFWASEMGTFGKSNCFRTTKNGTSGAKIKISETNFIVQTFPNYGL